MISSTFYGVIEINLEPVMPLNNASFSLTVIEALSVLKTTQDSRSTGEAFSDPESRQKVQPCTLQTNP